MKITQTTNRQISHCNIVPLFMEQPMVKADQTPTPNVELSIFDVKELYDRAYAMEADNDLFRALLTEALKMDMAYRQNLKEKATYKALDQAVAPTSYTTSPTDQKDLNNIRKAA